MIFGRGRGIVLELQDRPYLSPRDLGAPVAFENVQAEHGKEHQGNTGSQ